MDARDEDKSRVATSIECWYSWSQGGLEFSPKMTKPRTLSVEANRVSVHMVAALQGSPEPRHFMSPTSFAADFSKSKWTVIGFRVIRACREYGVKLRSFS